MENVLFISFKKHIDYYCQISIQIWDEVKKILSIRILEKDEYILKENQISNLEIFVKQGILRGFYCSNDGDEYNVVFYKGGDLVCPYFARTKNGKSNINLQALIQTEIITMDQEKMKNLRHKYPELFMYGVKVVENELNNKIQREIDLLMKDAEERYLLFRQNYPDLESRISQYHIASYLKITPVSLSRLRKNLINK
jgi:CRP-like cAMP-binding protein